ncbi:IS66 family transposase [Sinorhizobium meliloti]|uniref:IS66 family transposase n=1 Tax=Rhizobium meliloti TaxID=382 RepID=UPI002D21C263|nr:transposase [Sinorhizobium meliloti]
MAHTRRDLCNEFLRNRSPAAGRARNLISDLFAIEAEVNGSDPQMRLGTRRARSLPVLDKYFIPFFAFPEGVRRQALPSKIWYFSDIRTTSR